MDTNQIIEHLGQLIDTADNYLVMDANPYASSKLKAENFAYGLKILRTKIKELYFELGGENWWGNNE
jgi:hypothetical protein